MTLRLAFQLPRVAGELHPLKFKVFLVGHVYRRTHEFCPHQIEVLRPETSSLVQGEKQQKMLVSKNQVSASPGFKTLKGCPNCSAALFGVTRRTWTCSIEERSLN